MATPYVRRLSAEDRQSLLEKLHEIQSGDCFICEKSIDLELPANTLDFDHVVPTSEGGKDDSSNLALTHDHCNRSKQATDLRVARLLSKFEAISEEVQLQDRSADLGDILDRYGGAKHDLAAKFSNGKLTLSFPEVGQVDASDYPVFEDKVSGFRSSFVSVPLEYLHHDREINPRAIGNNIRKLIIEFHKGLPQLHASLGWIDVGETESPKLRLFDGQHKAAAQILLGAKELPVRVFISPDIDVLLTANTNAGTTLRQVAFDKSVQRSLGSSILSNRLQQYKLDHQLEEEIESFSERDLVEHFRGEARAMRRYVVDRVRNGITHHPENKLSEYIELGGRGTSRPLSYSTIEKTFYQFFISADMLSVPFNHKHEEGRNPRQLEIDQVVRLMNIAAQEIYVGQFDFVRGTSRLESDVQKGNDVDDAHLRAFRMSKEEVVHNWVRLVRQIVFQYFVLTGRPTDEKRLFQSELPNDCWTNIENFFVALKEMPVWVNRGLSASIFGGKRSNDVWQDIFATGSTPDGVAVLPQGLDLVEMCRGGGD